VNIIRRWKRRALLVSEEEERPWGVSERNGMHLHSLAMNLIISQLFIRRQNLWEIVALV
jgi:hypothetical protein